MCSTSIKEAMKIKVIAFMLKITYLCINEQIFLKYTKYFSNILNISLHCIKNNLFYYNIRKQSYNVFFIYKAIAHHSSLIKTNLFCLQGKNLNSFEEVQSFIILFFEKNPLL